MGTCIRATLASSEGTAWSGTFVSPPGAGEGGDRQDFSLPSRDSHFFKGPLKRMQTASRSF